MIWNYCIEKIGMSIIQLLFILMFIRKIKNVMLRYYLLSYWQNSVKIYNIYCQVEGRKGAIFMFCWWEHKTITFTLFFGAYLNFWETFWSIFDTIQVEKQLNIHFLYVKFWHDLYWTRETFYSNKER